MTIFELPSPDPLLVGCVAFHRNVFHENHAEVRKKIVVIKMPSKILGNNMLHDLTKNTGQRNWPVAAGSFLSPFCMLFHLGAGLFGQTS